MERDIGIAEQSVRAHAEFTGDPLYMSKRYFPTWKLDWGMLRK